MRMQSFIVHYFVSMKFMVLVKQKSQEKLQSTNAYVVLLQSECISCFV